MLGELYDGEFASMEHNGRMDACMSEEISREEIAALLARESEEMTREPCEDAISIQVVIEWLKDKDIIKLSSQEETARKELKALPSVTPKQEPCKDAISRQAAIDYFFRPYSNEES